jgi:hypothetical protein
MKFNTHIVMNDPHHIIIFDDHPLHPIIIKTPYIIVFWVCIERVSM